MGDEDDINFFAQWDPEPPRQSPVQTNHTDCLATVHSKPSHDQPVIRAHHESTSSDHALLVGPSDDLYALSEVRSVSEDGGDKKKRVRKKKVSSSSSSSALVSNGNGSMDSSADALTEEELASISSALSLADAHPPLNIMGLINSGNACFRNVVLQSLSSLPPLTSLLHKLCADESGVSGPFWRELVSFFKQLQPPDLRSTIQSSSSPSSVMVPDDSFVTTFRSFREQTTGHSTAPSAATQEDAMEFLTFLLDALHEESRTGGPAAAAASVEVPPAAGSSSRVSAPEWSEVSHMRSRTKSVVDSIGRAEALAMVSSSHISRIFHGVYRSEVLYIAKKVNSVTFQRYHCISLDIKTSAQATSACNNHKEVYRSQPSSSSSSSLSLSGRLGRGECVDISKALASHFNSEDMGEMKKTLLLEHTPLVLVLQLKRFAYDAFYSVTSKVESFVTYPLELTLDLSHMSAELRTACRGECVYELVAAVLHHGASATGGHYTAACRDAFRQWRHFDDAKVRTVTASEALAHGSEVYLLFYCIKG